MLRDLLVIIMEVYIYVYLNRPVITSNACANKHAWMYVDDFKMTFNMIHASVINAHKCVCICVWG